jgi:hypothetical protein
MPDLLKWTKTNTITHFVLSLFPNWIGQKQQRIVRIEGDAQHCITNPVRRAAR